MQTNQRSESLEKIAMSGGLIIIGMVIGQILGTVNQILFKFVKVHIHQLQVL